MDALEGLCLALGEKSLCYQGAQPKQPEDNTLSMGQCSQVGCQSLKVSVHISASSKYFAASGHWPWIPAMLYDIADDNLKVTRDITDKQRFDQQSDALPWFWRIRDGTDSSGPWMQECGYFCLPSCACLTEPTNPPLVCQVSWLRAKAHISSWLAELHLVELEMQWTVNWFCRKEEGWNKRLRNLEDEERPPGLDCYCHKQMVLWGSLVDWAQAKFSTMLVQSLFWQNHVWLAICAVWNFDLFLIIMVLSSENVRRHFCITTIMSTTISGRVSHLSKTSW